MDQAITELRRAAEISQSSPPLSLLSHELRHIRESHRSEELLDELMEQSKKRYVSPFYVAIVYAGLGENDQA